MSVVLYIKICWILGPFILFPNLFIGYLLHKIKHPDAVFLNKTTEDYGPAVLICVLMLLFSPIMIPVCSVYGIIRWILFGIDKTVEKLAPKFRIE